MSSAQNVKQHPAVIQAQNKANYYVGQLDKEVRYQDFGDKFHVVVSHDLLHPCSSPDTRP